VLANGGGWGGGGGDEVSTKKCFVFFVYSCSVKRKNLRQPTIGKGGKKMEALKALLAKNKGKV